MDGRWSSGERSLKSKMDFIESFNGISDRELNEFLSRVVEKIGCFKKILVVHPDYTRVDFTNKIVPFIASRLGENGAERIDFLNAGGTHRQTTEQELLGKLGLKRKERYMKLYNHQYNDSSNIITIGTISRKIVKEKTNSDMIDSIPVTLNKLVFEDYDLIIAVSGTVPHEAGGYSGGLKIFLPGISGSEIIDLFHWIAALIGIPNIIGTINNNARDIINQGSFYIFKKIKAKIFSFNMVSIEKKDETIPIGLYIDNGFEGFKTAYEAASLASLKIYVRYISEPLKQVVQNIPGYYDEMWTAGKGSYKLQRVGVMAEGGEIILYAPHIKCFHSNKNMNREILSLGYHCKDKIFCLIKSKDKIFSRNVAAHVINVTGPGKFNGKTDREEFNFKVTLATGIPEKVCSSVGLGYRDPRTLKREDFKGQGKLWIEDGGKYLYDLRVNRKEN